MRLTPTTNTFSLAGAPVSNMLHLLPDGLGGFLELPTHSADTLDSYTELGNLRWSIAGPWLSAFHIEAGMLTYCQPSTEGVVTAEVDIITGAKTILNDGLPVTDEYSTTNTYSFAGGLAFGDTAVLSKSSVGNFLKKAGGEYIHAMPDAVQNSLPRFLEGTMPNTCQATYRTPNGSWFGFITSEPEKTQQGVLGGYNSKSATGSDGTLYLPNKIINASVPIRLFPVQVDDKIVLIQQTIQRYSGSRVFDKTHFDEWVDYFVGGM